MISSCNNYLYYKSNIQPLIAWSPQLSQKEFDLMRVCKKINQNLFSKFKNLYENFYGTDNAETAVWGCSFQYLFQKTMYQICVVLTIN